MATARRTRLYDEADPLTLAGGGTLAPVDVAYTTHGDLAPDRDNVVFVAHALTGDADAARWWSTMVGPGRPVDTERFYVVCANLLGGCAGTTGPSSTNPATGLAWGLDFPLITVADLVTVHRRLLAHLGVEKVYAAIGGSLGGMQVLQWAADAPSQIERAVLVAASARLSTQNIALSTVARQAILRDPDFRDGRYQDHGVLPSDGLAVARMLGHITYVSEPGLEAKFGRARRGLPGFGVDFEVESYLDHQGTSFVDRFDALSYLYLSRLLDYFDPFADDGFAQRIGETSFQLISFDSDWRFATSHSLLIEEELRRAGIDVERHEIASSWGHDSFLMDPPGYLDLVRTFLTDRTGDGS